MGYSTTVAAAAFWAAIGFGVALIGELRVAEETFEEAINEAVTGLDYSHQSISDAETFAALWLRIAFFGYLVVGVLFIVWFYQAYRSAVSRGASGTRWGAGWTIGSWFVPVANLVIPKLVMNEVDRMSNPMSGEPPIEQRWRTMDCLSVSNYWWVFTLVAWVFTLVALVAQVSGFGGYSAGYAISAGFYAISLVFMGIMVMKIGGRLEAEVADGVSDPR